MLEHSLNAPKLSDIEMIRVLDDLIQILTNKDVLRITDLLAATQEKLLDRNRARLALGIV